MTVQIKVIRATNKATDVGLFFSIGNNLPVFESSLLVVSIEARVKIKVKVIIAPCCKACLTNKKIV